MALPKQKWREIVFILLYSLDLGTNSEKDLIEMVMKELSCTRKTVKEALEEAKEVLTQLEAIDTVIAKTSDSFSFERIQSVEKNILRLSLNELLFKKEIPGKVVISEGIRLARKFGTPESSSFVNAILDQIYKLQNMDTGSDELSTGEESAPL